MRTYLVICDDTPEAEVALRFAARRASRTGGAIQVLVIVPRSEFLAWGGVQATMQDEARENAESVMARAFDMLEGMNGIVPRVSVKQGDAVTVIKEALAENPDIGALVLGAAAVGNPGPLVAHFAGVEAGSLPCPLMIVPGGLPREALDRLS
jgi:nucleotide-binding universal stress UspA family protein